jgi:hypothetical protein
MLTANEMVVRDIERLATAGDMLNSFENTGKMGCVQFITAKVVKPPENKAVQAFRKDRVPCCI